MLNGNGLENISEYYARRSDLDRLEVVVHNDIIPSLARIECAQNTTMDALKGIREDHMDALKAIREDLKEIQTRHIQQKAVLDFIKKIPNMMSLVFRTFLITVFFSVLLGGLIMLEDHNFSLKGWLFKQARTTMHIE